MNNNIHNETDVLLDEHQIAELTGFSLSRLRNDRYLKQGIPFIKIGSSVRYRMADYRAFIEQSRVDTARDGELYDSGKGAA
ncbi:helix-turn-helix transcriptional regulator [Amphritea sp. HPY]|uniref:helix-turn-helix transcriptional regulator n=1 Tax=Amphritea sp. HPY TaxID=3421652 RepID=UPI003D7EF4EC